MSPLTFAAIGRGLLALLKKCWWATPLLLIALLVLRWQLNDARSHLAKEIAFGNAVYEATKAAVPNLRLARRDTAAQITLLGNAVTKLRTGLQTCTSTAKAAEANDKARQAEFEQQLAAIGSAGDAQRATVDRLLRSAANAPRPPAGACEPSPTLKEIWR